MFFTVNVFIFGTRTAEVVNNLIMKITAKTTNVNDIFADVLVTPATFISIGYTATLINIFIFHIQNI